MSPTAWNKWFGRQATRKLALRIVPHIRRNQEIWGETVLNQLRPNVRWLDAGCGWRILDDGLEDLETTLATKPQFAVGVDLDFPHLRRHISFSRRAQASLDELPFSPGSFDLITCNMVAEHLPEPLPIFKELARVLAPGGRIMLHTPNTANYLVLANIVAKKILPKSVVGKLINDGRAEEDIFPTFYRANSMRALRTLGQSSGLQVEFARVLTHQKPYTRFFAPLAVFELLLMRATMSPGFERYGTTIMICFRKPSQNHPATGFVSANEECAPV